MGPFSFSGVAPFVLEDREISLNLLTVNSQQFKNADSNLKANHSLVLQSATIGDDQIYQCRDQHQ